MSLAGIGCKCMCSVCPVVGFCILYILNEHKKAAWGLLVLSQWSLLWVLFGDSSGVNSWLFSDISLAVFLNVGCFLHLLFLRLYACQVTKKKITITFVLSVGRRLRDGTGHCSYYSRHWPCKIYQQEHIQVRRVSTVVKQLSMNAFQTWWPTSRLH